MSFNNSSSTPNSCFFVSKKQTTPWPPSKALEWTFVEWVTPPTKHENSWELKCEFCAKEFKVTLITRIREQFFGTLNNIELCLAILQETLQPLREQVAKALKQKELGKRKMETFTSKVIDLTQPKLQTIWNVQKREKMDKIIAKCFLDVGFLLMSSNQFISNK
jgi:hypothetical protein